MKLKFLFILSMLTSCIASGQDFDIPVNHRVILSLPDHIVYADILMDDPDRIKVRNELFYHWYNNHDIKSTRGGFDGKLLHGTYMDFYPNKNLKEKGSFRYGLKNGEWKSWYLTGELKEIVTWKKGRRHGSYKLFDKYGNLTEEGKYEKECLDGKIKKYKDRECTVEKYKNGELVQKKEGKSLLRRLKRKKEKSEKEESENKKPQQDKNPKKKKSKEVN